MKWLLKYDGNNHAVRRLQLELNGYYYTVAHRPGWMLEDANFLLGLEEDTHFDPLIRDYLSFAWGVHSNNKPSNGDLSANNMPGRRTRSLKENGNKSASLAVIQYRDSNHREISIKDLCSSQRFTSF